MTYDFNLMT